MMPFLACTEMYTVVVADATVNATEFRANLAHYLERAHAGETITITRAGRPDAVVGPVEVRSSMSEAEGR